MQYMYRIIFTSAETELTLIRIVSKGKKTKRTAHEKIGLLFFNFLCGVRRRLYKIWAFSP